MEQLEAGRTKTGSAARRKRQQILSDILAPSTANFIKEVNLPRGVKGLDLGCGTGETTLLLKKWIGHKANIIGFDSRSIPLQIAREKVQRISMPYVEFRYQNILEWQEKESYSFVYSRHFFYELRHPLSVLKQVYKSLKPGGLAMIEDFDFTKIQCFPSSYAFDRFIELYVVVIKRQGADTNIGQQLYPLLQQAGFKNNRAQLVSPQFLTGKNKRIASLTLEIIAPILEKENLATGTEIQVLLLELKNFESQKNTMITLPGIYQAWGYRL